MSQLIVVQKAFDAVKQCCAETMAEHPWGKADAAITMAIRTLRSLMPASEAFAGGRPLTTLQTPPAGTGQSIPRGVPFAAPSSESQVMVSVRTLSHSIRRLEQAKETMRTDPCSLMLGCVARRWKKLILEQKGGGRTKYVNREWIGHFLGRDPGAIPETMLKRSRRNE